MQTYYTVNSITTELEALYTNVTGRKQLSAIEADIVNGCIIDAYQFVLLEYGVANFKFHEEDIEVDTDVDQNFVDLDEYVFRVVPGTMRIPAENARLGLIDEPAIYAADPNLEQTSLPTSYAYMNSTDPNILRLLLWPVPDQVYTIKLKGLKYPTDTITNFPTSLQSAIKFKAKALACMSLGITQHQIPFNATYEEIMAKIKDGYEGGGPIHVGRTYVPPVGRSVESRIPS